MILRRNFLHLLVAAPLLKFVEAFHAEPTWKPVGKYKRYMGTQAKALPVEDLPRVIEELSPGKVRVEYTGKDGTTKQGIRRQGQHDAAGGIGVPSPGYAMGGAVHREAAELMTELTGVKWTPEEILETAWSLFKSVT